VAEKFAYQVEQTFMKYTFWVTIGALILISGGIVAYVTCLHYSLPLTLAEPPLSATPVTPPITSKESSPLPNPAGTAVTLDGELVCLPHRAGDRKELTLECAIGLHTAEGEHYALGNINPYLMERKVALGQRVKVKGLLRSDMETRFDIIGIIDVTAIDTLEN
jgi:hypothetical protein